MKKQIQNIIEDLGWRINKCGDGTVELEKSSPAGEDFIFSVSEKNIVADIEEYAATFDPDEHVEMWSMAKRFGTSGVPTISELVEDAKAIEDMLEELSRRVADPEGYVKRYPTNWERLKELNHDDAAQALTELFYKVADKTNAAHYIKQWLLEERAE